MKDVECSNMGRWDGPRVGLLRLGLLLFAITFDCFAVWGLVKTARVLWRSW
jgi:hypothetical protein